MIVPLALYGIPNTDAHAVALHPSRWSIRGWGAGVMKDSEACIAFAQAQNIKAMVEVFPLDKAPEAFSRRTTAKFRAVIVPNL